MYTFEHATLRMSLSLAVFEPRRLQLNHADILDDSKDTWPSAVDM
jgi:hypothetical protein